MVLCVEAAPRLLPNRNASAMQTNSLPAPSLEMKVAQWAQHLLASANLDSVAV
jgi:hypothetical protein